MPIRLHLSPRHRGTLERLLREHLPDVDAWAYGSRVNGDSQAGSDLDLALRAPGLNEIPAEQLADFRDAVCESTIPFHVEARDWAQLPERFQREIARDHVPLNDSALSRAVDGTQKVQFAKLLAEPVRNGLYKTKQFHGRGVKVVNMGELFAHPRLRDVPMKRVELTDSEKSRFCLRPGDLLFARRSLVAEGAGKCCVVLETPEPTAFESSIIRARPNAAKADSLFLYYYFSSPTGLHSLDTIRRQVAVAGITGTDLANLDIRLPPVAEQRAIACVLGALDHKIELNRRMNETLETMARALFKSWFVDFEPVRAKTEGRDTYLPRPISNLFPESVGVDGNPAGWATRPLDEVATFLNGLALQKFPASDIAESLPVIKIAELRNGVTPKSSRASPEVPANYQVRDGDFLFSWSGSLLAKFWTGGPGALNQHLFKVTSSEYPHWFFSQWVYQHLEQFRATAKSKATTMGHIQRRHLSEALTVCPPKPTLEAMDVVFGPMVARIVHNDVESRTLGLVRDELLPRLISGELRVPDAERLVESAT